ncbi:hypothetical protein [Leisingera sp. M658]|uniref:hypothetical protein n=1 Tax=Leisingera sp. M658 TaxID=2867015 RepID=UPI0021A87A17|nr:hypothetical protein [Leisingera sp. M658]UWQ77380.1 hypothetical protein K3724_22610 [Leisingera sp. M658]
MIAAGTNSVPELVAEAKSLSETGEDHELLKLVEELEADASTNKQEARTSSSKLPTPTVHKSGGRYEAAQTIQLSREAKHLLCGACGYPGHFTAPASAYDEVKAYEELKAEGYGDFGKDGAFFENDKAHSAAETLLFNH